MRRFGCRILATRGFLYALKRSSSGPSAEEPPPTSRLPSAPRSLPRGHHEDGLPAEILLHGNEPAPLGPRWKSLVTHRFHVARYDHHHHHHRRPGWQGHDHDGLPWTAASATTSELLARMMKPLNVTPHQRQQHPLATEGPYWIQYGILPWEIHSNGIA